MHPHNPGSYLGNLDEAFTWISKKVLQEGVMSVVSYNPAEICHHLERRLTNPTAILDSHKIAPITAREHTTVHDGTRTIQISEASNGNLYIVDLLGARFQANPERFRELWQYYLDRWYANYLDHDVSKRGP